MAWCEEDRVLLRLLYDEADGAVQPVLLVSLDWDYIVETAAREGVAGLLHYNLKRAGIVDRIPVESYQQLQGLYNANLTHNMFALGELRSLLKAFNERNIPVIILKGMALAEHVYPSIGVRGMGDVDILVKRGNLHGVDSLLSGMGYSPRDSALPDAIDNPVGYLASLDYQRDDRSSLSLHIHWHLVNTSVPAYMFAPEIDMDHVWDMAWDVRVADVESRILSPAHQIIHLCEHGLRIGHSFDRLVLMCDIVQVAGRYEKDIDWGLLIRECQNTSLSKMVYLALTIVQHYFPLRLPRGIMARLKPSHITLWDRIFLHLNVTNGRARGSSYLVYLAMNKGLLEKCRFVFRTLFPPSQILLQRQYSRDRRSRRLFYLLRVFEIAGHGVAALCRSVSHTRA